MNATIATANTILMLRAKIKALSTKAEWSNGSFSNTKTYKGKAKDKKHVPYNHAAREITKIELAIEVIKAL